MQHDHVKILLVEDNEADVVLTTEAFEDAKLTNEMIIARDGYEAMEYLSQKGKYQGTGLPDIILLDLNLPGPSGHTILEFVKSDPTLEDIPVVVLTSSNSEVEIKQIYNLKASCYIVKPVDVSKFIDVVRVIENFWVQIVKLPK